MADVSELRPVPRRSEQLSVGSCGLRTRRRFRIRSQGTAAYIYVLVLYYVIVHSRSLVSRATVEQHTYELSYL